ncbi:hypothetical protein [Vibrio chagasii]|uniref:hypothetical protein n=1 Tax=Vibrio chagasii TaxID=170679 RepID=UPI003735E5C2
MFYNKTNFLGKLFNPVTLLLVIIITPIVNSMGCNYHLRANIQSPLYGKGTIVGQCYLGITEYLSTYQDGTSIKVKALSFVTYDRIIFIDVDRVITSSNTHQHVIEKNLHLGIPIFYPIKYQRLSKDVVLAITPTPRNQLIPLQMSGSYSLYDSITSN